MESFALSETLKVRQDLDVFLPLIPSSQYLYLLFDEENPLHTDTNYVFTTEGHILSLDKKHIKPVPPARRRMRKIEDHQCPAYHPLTIGNRHSFANGLTVGVKSRPDVDYSQHLTGTTSSINDERYWHPHGWCERPRTDLYVSELNTLR